MNITDENVEIANELRILLCQRTGTVSDAEGVAMVLLWSFLTDHSMHEGDDLATLARYQLEAFIAHVAPHMSICHERSH